MVGYGRRFIPRHKAVERTRRLDGLSKKVGVVDTPGAECLTSVDSERWWDKVS